MDNIATRTSAEAFAAVLRANAAAVDIPEGYRVEVAVEDETNGHSVRCYVVHEDGMDPLAETHNETYNALVDGLRDPDHVGVETDNDGRIVDWSYWSFEADADE